MSNQPDYAWPTVADYERETGYVVNEAFKIGWRMARATNDMFEEMAKQAEEKTDE